MGGTDAIAGSVPGNSMADAPIEEASPTPTVRGRSWLIVSGVLAVCLLVGALTLLRDESAPEPIDVSLPAGVSLPAVSPPPGFTSSELPNGWTRYTSETEGFSVALPPDWRVDTEGARENPQVRLFATDLVPTFPPITAGGSPNLAITRWAVNESELPSRYWEYVRQQTSQDPTSVGEATLRQTHLRDGLTYVLTATFEASMGQRAAVMYGLLRGSTEWRLVFDIPADYSTEYEDVFHDIAMTFDITT